MEFQESFVLLHLEDVMTDFCLEIKLNVQKGHQ